jgi:hypothetical protein
MASCKSSEQRGRESLRTHRLSGLAIVAVGEGGPPEVSVVWPCPLQVEGVPFAISVGWFGKLQVQQVKVDKRNCQYAFLVTMVSFCFYSM